MKNFYSVFPVRSALRPAMGSQVEQQALERLLVGVLIFPPAEVSKMPGTTEIDGPGHIRLLHLLIQADEEKHQFVLLRFLLKDSHDLPLDPRAVDRMLREDDEELIVQANRFINAMSEILTDLQVFRRSEPARHATASQVAIQPFGKVLVLAGIGNEAGVVLDGMGQQRTRVDEEVFWNAGSAQKNLGNVAGRAVDGIDAKRRGISMLHRLKPFHRTQVDVVELGPSYFRAADVGIPQVGTTEIGAAQVSIAEISRAEAGTTEVGIAQVGMVEARIAAVGNTEIGACKVGIAQVGVAEKSLVEVSTLEIGTFEVGIAEVSIAQIGMPEVSTADVSITEISIAQLGIAQLGIPEVGAAQVGTAEIALPQIRTAQVSIAEVGLAQVRADRGMLLSPGIPDIPSLPQQTKLLSIYQGAHPLLVLPL